MTCESIVSAKWLASQLNNPNVIVVDCRFRLPEPIWGRQQYSQSHIPGAYYLDLNQDLSAPVTQHGGRHPLPDPQLLAQKLAAIGIIKNETLVVAYDNSRFAFASRLWWLLRFLGHERAALLDGGWSNWLKEGYFISDEIPLAKLGVFIPQPHWHWIVDIETVKTALERSTTVIIDSRDSERYRGEKEPIDPIAGHIPGAVNFPWQAVADTQGFLQPIERQQALWSHCAATSEIIVYCGSGVTACVNLFL